MRAKTRFNKVKRITALALTLLMVISFFRLSPMFNNVKAAVGDTPAHTKNLTDNHDGTYTLSLDVVGDSEKKPNNINVIVILDRSSSMTTQRMNAAKNAINSLANSLYAYNTQSEPNTVEMALVIFSNTATIQQQPTNNATTFRNSVNGVTVPQGGGTNWEGALQMANNVDFDDDDQTFAIFVSDGNPTFRYTEGNYPNHNNDYNATYYRDYGVWGSGSENDAVTVQRCYDHAVDDAQALASAVTPNNFFTIGAFGSVDRMQSLTTAAGAPIANYYSAQDTAALNQAISDILAKIEMAGIANTEIDDGTTNQVTTTSGGIAELLEVDESSYKYYRSGGSYGNMQPWTGAPEAELVNGTVEWDLSSVGVLENGVRYTVTFDVYPSQYTYDTIARLKNGDVKYSELDPEIQKYIIEAGENNYTLLTNTNASLSWDDTRDDAGQQTDDYINPDPVKTDAVPMLTVAKDWEGGDADVDSLPLTVMMGNEKFHTATLSDDNGWQDSFYISVGIIKNGQVLSGAEGHDFSFAELDDSQYHWELEAPTVRPMLIDGGGEEGKPTILVKSDDKHPVPSGATTYTIDGATYYVDSAASSLTATNHRRSNLNLTKVVTGEDAPEDATFPFTLTVKNSKAPATEPTNDPEHNSDYWVWFSIYDTKAGATVMDATVSGATGPSSAGYYYAVSGTAISVQMKDGWNLRFTNLPTDTTYTFVEGSLADGFVFNKAELTAGTDTTFSGDQTSTGTIQSTKTSYTVTYTNDYDLTDLEITKVWVDNKNQDGIRLTADELKEKLTLSPAVEGAEPTIVDNGDDTYTITYTGLPRFNGGQEIEYTVTEAEIEDYTTEGSPAKDHGTITNTHEPEVTEATVIKVWDDEENQDGKRPTSLKVTLSNGTEVTLDESNQWTATIDNLPKYNNGEEIEYTWTEDEEGLPEGYELTDTSVEGTVTTLTNSYEPETDEITVTKIWDDADDQDGKRPDDVTFIVTGSDGNEYTVTFDGTGSTWTETVEVAKYYNEGEEVTFTVDEEEVTDYEKEIDDPNLTITNSYEPETEEITVTKIWDDENDKAGLRPDDVTFTVTGSDGNTYRVTLSGTGDTWTENVEVAKYYNGGEEVTFTVDENAITGYTKSIDNENLTITNTHTDSEKDVTAVISDTEVHVDGAIVSAGEVLTYTITYANNTADTATVIITDEIPDNTEYVEGSASDDGDYSDGTITWTIENVASGATGSVTFQVKVNEDITDVTTIENEANVDDGENQSTTNLVTTSIPVKDVKDEDGASIDGESVQVGDILTYEITFKITEDADSVIVKDEIPENTTLVDGSIDNGGTESGGLITWDLGAKEAGTYTVSFQVTVDESAVQAGTIENTATINVNGNGDVETNITQNDPEKGDLKISKTVTVPEGFEIDTNKEFEFTITLTDKKDNPLTGSYAYNGDVSGNITSGGTINLKHGQTVTIKDLPAGAKYTIVETAVDGYTPTPSSRTLEGSIEKNNEATAAFTNAYTVTPNTANIPVVKDLVIPEGLTGPTNASWTVTLTSEDEDAPMPEETEGTISADEGFTFGPIEYSKAGTYTYTVTESGEVAGVENDEESEKTVTVQVEDNGDGTLNVTVSATEDDPVSFTNTYDAEPVDVDPPVKKEITGTEELYNKGDFTFTISGSDGAPMPAKTSITNIKDNELADKPGFYEFGVITFTEPGEYTYEVTESGSVLGVTNDSQATKSFTFSVTDGGEGKLVVTPTSDEAVFEFTNAYKTAELDITKTVENEIDPDDDTKFTFTVTFTDADGKELDDEFPYTIGDTSGTISSGGTVQLGNGETAKITGIPDGANYTVTETAVDGYETTKSNDSGAVSADAAVTAAFTNTYNVEAVEFELFAGKKLEVEEPANNPPDVTGKYTISIEADEGTPMPENTSFTNADGEGTMTSFGKITYDKPGDYQYTIKEEGTVPGVENGQTSYTVKVSVSDNKDGTLSVEVAEGEAETLFTNTYKVEPVELEKGFNVKKVVEGTTLVAGEFEFEVTGDKPLPDPAKASNDADGNVEFNTITYDTPGTYKYTISEINDGKGGYTYDTHTVTVTVEVTDNGEGELEAEVTYDGEQTFQNTYKVSGEVELSAKKTLEGRALEEGQFTFELLDENGEVIQTKTNNGSGAVKFDAIEYSQDDFDDETESEDSTTDETTTDDSTTNESSTEDTPTQQSVDEEIVPIEEEEEEPVADEPVVEEPVEEEEAVEEIIIEEEEPEEEPAETEEVESEETEEDEIVTLSEEDEVADVEETEAEEIIIDEPEAEEIFEEEPVIEETEEEPVIEEAAEEVDETADDEIELAAPERTKTFTYTIREVNDGAAGYKYDEHEVTVTVTVSDDGAGNLTAVAKYDGDTEFINYYTAEGEAQFEGIKEVEGTELEEGQFTFQLKKGNEVIEEVANDGDGNFTFEAINYDQDDAGKEIKYTIVEVNDGQKGYTYDDHICDVTVKVTDNGDGTLTCDVTYSDGDKAAFKNPYKPLGTSVVIKATKELTGKKLTEGMFTFELKDAEGNVVDTATNDASGNIKFKAIAFDEETEVTYTVSEVKGKDKNMTYDETEYEVTITVKDVDGQLTAEVEGGEGIVFKNKYKEPEPEPEPDPEPPTPPTGDNSHTWIWLLVMLAAGIELASLIYVRVRKSNK